MSNRLRNRLLLGALCAVLLPACGLLDKSSNNAPDDDSTDDSVNDQTGGTTATLPEALGAGWSFGTGVESVISSPVLDEDGNVYLVVGLRDEPRMVPTQQPLSTSPQAVKEARVVSLDPKGQERFRSEPICDATVAVTEYTALAVQGSHIYAACGHLVVLDSDGSIVWNAVGYGGGGIAVDESGVVVVGKGQSPLTYSAFDADGSHLWDSTVGIKISALEQTKVSIQTSPIISSGALYVPYDALEDAHTAAAAQLSLADGSRIDALRLEGQAVPNTYGTLAGMPGGGVAAVQDDVFFRAASGTGTYPAGTRGAGSPLVDANSVVYLAGLSPGKRLMRGADVVSESGYEADNPAALLTDGVVLLDSGTAVKAGGEVVFTLDDGALARHSVVAQDGALLYVTTDQRLVSVQIPVEGLDPNAAWPTVAGPPSGNHRFDK